MIEVGLYCGLCDNSIFTEVQAKYRPARWTRLMQRIVNIDHWGERRKWITDNICEHIVHCPDCIEKVNNTGSYVSYLNLKEYPFYVRVVCEYCKKYINCEDMVHAGDNFIKDIRKDVSHKGWRRISTDGQRTYHDYCPDCVDIVTAHIRNELIKHVWSIPTIQLARLIGISDKAIEKKCTRYRVPKPPRGFWNKYEVGLITECLEVVPYEVREVLGEEKFNELYPQP